MNLDEKQQHCRAFLKKNHLFSVINKYLRYSILVHAENGSKYKINGWGQSVDVPANKSGQKKILGLI